MNSLICGILKGKKDFKKKKKERNQNRLFCFWWLPEEGIAVLSESDQKVQTFSYKIN